MPDEHPMPAKHPTLRSHYHLNKGEEDRKKWNTKPELEVYPKAQGLRFALWVAADNGCCMHLLHAFSAAHTD